MQSSNTTLPAAHPVFNNQYEILKVLGEGNTSKVYLGRSVNNYDKQVAIKILKEEFLTRDQDSIRSVQSEITILRNLSHSGIIGLLDYGDSGQVVKPSGRTIDKIVFIVMEYVEGGLLFDLCQSQGAMGEKVGRFFAHQLLESIAVMHDNKVVHRDLKLENILLGQDLNLKIADFGFACYKNIDCLKSYRGTMTYMAPEIKENKEYNGTQVDMFSFGVILFIIVQGIFPFKEARTEEYFYNLLTTGQHDLYFKKVNGEGLSDDFKSLITGLFCYNPKQRLTLDQVRAHPWFASDSFELENTRDLLQQQIQSRQQVQSAPSQQNSAKPLNKPTKVRRNAIPY